LTAGETALFHISRSEDSGQVFRKEGELNFESKEVKIHGVKALVDLSIEDWVAFLLVPPFRARNGFDRGKDI
jgi:hypothetical protein